MSLTKRYYFPEIYEILPEEIYEKAEQIRDERREDGIPDEPTTTEI